MIAQATHDLYLERCAELGQKAGKNTQTNPWVGAVLVYDDRIIGEGYHAQYGGPHAEINALNSVADIDYKHIKDSILYVSLEPCSHYGKTPPCAHRIVQEGIKRVIVAVLDPNPLVAGRGIRYLKDQGVEVSIRPHASCKSLLDRFIIHLSKKTFIALKWAQSSDNFVGKMNEKTLISQPATQVLVHKWRSEYDGILVGKNTVLIDNPSLNVRHYRGNNPIRIIMDSHLQIPQSHKIFNDGLPTLIINHIKEGIYNHVQYIQVEDTRDMGALLRLFFKKKIYSLLVEGGPEIHKSFIESHNWHMAYVITNKCKLIDGVKAPSVTGHMDQKITLGEDTVYFIKNKSSYD